MLPTPTTAGRIAGLARACDREMRRWLVSTANYPIWWRGISAPPPRAWAYVFEDFTGEDSAEEWALAAAIFVAQTRRRTGYGPTFSELFSHLLPDTSGLPADFPAGLDFIERRRAISVFRGHAAIEWRRRNMISWESGVTRSLRVGRAFRELSRRRQLGRQQLPILPSAQQILSP